MGDNKFTIPNELKYEYYERKRFAATFDRMDLSLKFRSGVNEIGAICIKWVDGIYNHDAQVKKIEEQMDLIDSLRKIYDKENRTFKNWDAAWDAINTRPEDYAEFLDLRPDALNFHIRIQTITDSSEKAKAEAEYARYIELEPFCGKMYDAEKTLRAQRETRDATRKILVAEERALNDMREEERRIAARISDDHVVANSRGEYISELFPNIHLGYILSTINGVPVETLPFHQVLDVISSSRSPHRAIFRRYDFRTDPITGDWLSLQDLRDLGVFVEDPRSSRVLLVQTAAKGDYNGVKRALLSGEDVESIDHTHCTPLFTAAVNNHFEVVDLLIKAGANVNCRDKNNMTPLLACVRRKLHDMCRVLISAGADKTCTDRINRSALYFAVRSRDVGMVRRFLKQEGTNQSDTLWGWSPLHVAANQGDMVLTALLLEEGASIFHAAKDGRIPEQVARDAGQVEVMAFLEDKRLTAPAQLVYKVEGSNANIWIGEQDALEPRFVKETGLDAVVIYTSADLAPKKNAVWMTSDEKIRHEVVVKDDIDDDDEGDTSWSVFCETLSTLLEFVASAQREYKHKPISNILICDPSGQSTSPAALCAYLLLKYQVTVKKGVEMCQVARPIIDISLSMRRGLELLQRSLEEKKMKRLNDRVRESPSLSCAF